MFRHHLSVGFLVLALQFVPTRLLTAAELEAPGVPNFHEVNDAIYRGGQPGAEGWTSLQKLGIKTVIDLRRDGEHSIKAEQAAVTAAGMRYINVPMKGTVRPTNETILKLLALLQAKDSGPVFVHCRRGADRTGTVIACYRIAHDRWKNKNALKEAESFGMSWAELGMKRYVLRFLPPPQA